MIIAKHHKYVLEYKGHVIVETDCYPCKYTFYNPRGFQANSNFYRTIDEAKVRIDHLVSLDDPKIVERLDKFLKNHPELESRFNQIIKEAIYEEDFFQMCCTAIGASRETGTNLYRDTENYIIKKRRK